MSFSTWEIFKIDSERAFEHLALEIFNKQAVSCKVYQSYIQHLKIDPGNIKSYYDIPFLPISFFKTQTVLSEEKPVAITFSSSGTTGSINSKHQVTDLSVYEQSFSEAFRLFYGDIKGTCLLALLPSYSERDGSSLIYMVDALINESGHPDSGYFLSDLSKLLETLKKQKKEKQRTILIGVTYALLDFIKKHQLNFPELIVMETGGMKGRRKEMVRDELHKLLCGGFGVEKIHSEYGMTELLSQAYSKGDGIFDCPPWMKILLRDPNDPLSLVNNKSNGGINVIDLANVNSCSFIATQDLGKLNNDGTFEVLGRFDNSDIRGCNLLVQ